MNAHEPREVVRQRIGGLAQGHTQTQIACKFGVSLSTVKFWEQDRTQPATNVRAQVQAFLSTVPLANFPETQRGTSMDCRVEHLPSAKSPKKRHL
jgi:transcriptional regulator with XRE-family HTH domain